ncbi:MAG: hypothetical protein ORN49_01450, partial [Rhodobacteraceae bacterium]|nr:hypothetical protein [Paracoccaceae bacterium]
MRYNFRWLWRLSIVSLLAVFSTAGLAETIAVKAGEHPGFTRLVLQIDKRHSWRLGRMTSGYELRLQDGSDINFVYADVFQKIPRRRLSAIESLPRPGALALHSHCACFVRPSQLADGKLVIDIADGSAPLGSTFEQPLPEDSASYPPKNLPLRTIGSPSLQSRNATLPFRATVNQDTQLPIYWQNILDGKTKDDTATDTQAPHISRFPLPFPAPHPQENGPPPLAVPSSGLLATEAELLRQLSRAASQGMITLADPVPHKNGLPPRAGMSENPSLSVTKTHVHAQTSVDRDGKLPPPSPSQTAIGESCLDDESLALSHWGSDMPAAMQITQARSNLTGEFDRPKPAAVRAFARLYLYLAMGAEARQILRSFDEKSDDARMLDTLGGIIDGLPVAVRNPFDGMQDCDTSAALWAFLATPNKNEQVNIPAVLRAFSGLPPVLRSAIGHRLSDRLIQTGKPDAARDVRNAMARADHASENRNLTMIDATLALEAGQTDMALTRL